MRGLWNFILLGIVLHIGFHLAITTPLAENNESSDTIRKLEEFEKSREKDREELLENAAMNENDEIPVPGELFEGDMIMDESLREAVLGKADKRSVIKKKKKLWPKGIVYYEFDKNIRKDSKSSVLCAMRSFRKHTCIRFKKRKDEKDYIFLTSRRNMCSSYVGRRGGRQDVTIGRGCIRLGTCQHELFHALGTIHEQSRPDRDAHVRINWDNIRQGEKSNFRKYSYQRVSDFGIKYDFMSVMHYPNFAFAKDISYPTIESRSDPKLRFGQRFMFSRGDVDTINKLYKCRKDSYGYSLPQVLSDEEVKERRDLREQFDLDDE